VCVCQLKVNNLDLESFKIIHLNYVMPSAVFFVRALFTVFKWSTKQTLRTTILLYRVRIRASIRFSKYIPAKQYNFLLLAEVCMVCTVPDLNVILITFVYLLFILLFILNVHCCRSRGYYMVLRRSSLKGGANVPCAIL